MLQSRILLIAVSAIACCGLYSQSSKRSNEVNGMAGIVSILPNQNATHTTVVFNSSSPLTATSNQIVFVLQASNTALPPAWSGKARVLTGDGFVAIASIDNPGQRYLIKFPDRDVPASLSNQGFQIYETVGIARYGEQTPLTPDQISYLAATGRTCQVRGAQSKTATVDTPIDTAAGLSNKPFGVDPNPICPLTCTSGGAGSTSCSSGGGGCSVTCSNGFSACCNGNTNNCGCCKINE
jgi:hypothetical protein